MKASNFKVLRSINKETDLEGFCPSRSAFCYVIEDNRLYSKVDKAGCEVTEGLLPLIQSLHLKKPYISALLALFFCFVPHIVPHFCGLFWFFKSYKFLVPLYLPTKRNGQLFFPIAGPDETLTQEQENIVQKFNLRFKASSRPCNRFCSISCGFPYQTTKPLKTPFKHLYGDFVFVAHKGSALQKGQEQKELCTITGFQECSWQGTSSVLLQG